MPSDHNMDPDTKHPATKETREVILRLEFDSNQQATCIGFVQVIEPSVLTRSLATGIPRTYIWVTLNFGFGFLPGLYSGELTAFAVVRQEVIRSV